MRKQFRFTKFVPLMTLFVEGEGGGEAAPAGGEGSAAAAGDLSSAERALAYLNDNPEPPAASAAVVPGAESAAAAQAAPAGDQAAADKAAADAAAAAAAQAPPIDPKNWIAAEPIQQAITSVLGDYAKGPDGKVTGDQLNLVLEDAKAIYEIADGKRPPDEMLSMMKENYPKAFDNLLKKAMELGGVKPNAAAEDPAQKEIRELRERLDKQDRVKEEAQLQEKRQATVTGFFDQVKTNLSKQYPGLDAKQLEDITDLYAFFGSAIAGRDPNVVKRFESGNWADAQRIYTEFNNRMVGIVQAMNKHLVTTVQQRNAANPKIPAHGAPPAPAAPQKNNANLAKDRDERLRVATDYLRENQ